MPHCYNLLRTNNLNYINITLELQLLFGILFLLNIVKFHYINRKTIL